MATPLPLSQAPIKTELILPKLTSLEGALEKMPSDPNVVAMAMEKKTPEEDHLCIMCMSSCVRGAAHRTSMGGHGAQ